MSCKSELARGGPGLDSSFGTWCRDHAVHHRITGTTCDDTGRLPHVRDQGVCSEQIACIGNTVLPNTSEMHGTFLQGILYLLSTTCHFRIKNSTFPNSYLIFSTDLIAHNCPLTFLTRHTIHLLWLGFPFWLYLCFSCSVWSPSCQAIISSFASRNFPMTLPIQVIVYSTPFG